MTIRFGSDGWRGIIGQDFTLDNVARIACAVNEWWPEDSGQFSGEIFIGYDNRELSYEAAVHCWQVLKGLGKLRPLLPHDPRPSPYLSWATHEFGRPLSIQITASHNPPQYNGVKLKASYGGSMLAEDVAAVERLANASMKVPSPGGTAEPDSNDLLFDEHNYEQLMLEHAGSQIQRLIVDQMHGATDLYTQILGLVHEFPQWGVLRGNRDPTFGGNKPEPLEHLLPELIQRVKEANAATESGATSTVGLAFDGDGDRLAVIDETGAYLQSHEIFALLLDYLASKTEGGKRVYPGSKVVTTVSFSSLLGRIADSYGLDTIEVPVGFKHVTEVMLEGGVLIGGEESGGAAFGHYLPERDALLMALTLLRAKGEAGVTLHQMLRDIYARFGRTEFVHVDVQLDPASAQEFRARIPSLLDANSVAGESVTSRSDKDGVKLRTAEGWVLVRASGTEPLARFYAEAGSKDRAGQLIDDVRSRLL